MTPSPFPLPAASVTPELLPVVPVTLLNLAVTSVRRALSRFHRPVSSVRRRDTDPPRSGQVTPLWFGIRAHGRQIYPQSL